MHATLSRILVAPLLAVSLAAQGPAAKPAQDELFRTIAALDAELFDAYNQCDLEKFGRFFIEDVEFYHDQGGVTSGRKNLVESVKNNVCGKVRREIVTSKLEVHQMKGFGAVQIGVHRFHQPKVDSVHATGEARFIHLWQHKDGAWKITRVISFDHVSLKI